MIPKRIFYVWFGDQPLPKQYEEYIEGWHRLNPDFEIKCINENNFDIKKYRFAYEAYKAKKWAFVSDVARLDVIYNNGGIYLDTDVELIKGLSNLLSYRSVWALENSDSIASGLIIGAEKHDTNIKNILEIYKKLSYAHPNGRKIVTVPLISKYFLKQGFKRKNKKQVLNDGTVILPSEYFAPYHYWGGGHITSRTIGIHKYAASWNDNKRPTFFSFEGIKSETKLLMPDLFFFLKEKILKKGME